MDAAYKTSQLNNTRKENEYQNILPKMPCREDIRCDVDENMWPNTEDRADFYIIYIFII